MKIPFIKYTSFGNNFVIVDETETPVISETLLSTCASQVTDACFGVGSDGFILLQPCNRDVIEAINDVRQYWANPPEFESADYIFRIIEPNGNESFNCGNGLLAIANYLYHHKHESEVSVITEIPTRSPGSVTIGTHSGENISWVKMGAPRPIPKTMVKRSITRALNDSIATISDLNINFRLNGLTWLNEKETLDITGYLIFTGEPHLVIMVDTGFSTKELGDKLFQLPVPENNVDVSKWLVNYIGVYINKYYANIFPLGINVNFVRIIDTENGIIESRCFERGINQETLACGTGAVATAYIARCLNLIETDTAVIWPHRCRYHDPYSEMIVESKKACHMLYGSPSLLCKGEFLFNEKYQRYPVKNTE